MSAGLFELSHLNLDVGSQSPMYDWIMSRAGTAFLFVPINVMAFYFVPPGKMNNASGLINLARNIGASTGISFVTTMLDRRAQFHQNVLVSTLRPGDHDYQTALHNLTHLLITRGADAARAALEAHGLVYQQMQRQAMMLSFLDDFRIMAVICLCVIPLMFLMKRRKA
jgi:DHA2 family multidrug resistance protein